MKDKLVIITRFDLSKGYQIVQTAHALAEFAVDYEGMFKEWREKSAYLCCLSVDNEEDLKNFTKKLDELDIRYSTMRESDLDGQLTALAIQPLPKELHKKLYQKIKLSGYDG